MTCDNNNNKRRKLNGRGRERRGGERKGIKKFNGNEGGRIREKIRDFTGKIHKNPLPWKKKKKNFSFYFKKGAGVGREEGRGGKRWRQR